MPSPPSVSPDEKRLPAWAGLLPKMSCFCIDQNLEVESPKPADAQDEVAGKRSQRASTLLDDGQLPFRRVLLTDKGRKYLEEIFTRTEAPEGADISESEKFWRVHYDTGALSLIRQDVWLSKQDTTWELRGGTSGLGPLLGNTPPLQMDQQVPEAALQSINSERKILEQLLPSAPSEMEAQEPLEQLLAKHGVKPFARVWTEHRFFAADLPPAPPGTKNGAKTATIDLELMHFDSQYAEPAVVSLMLAAEKDGLPADALTIAFITFYCFPEGSGRSSQVDSFLTKHGLDPAGGGARKRTSLVAEYLRTCRPSHLRALKEAGVCLEGTGTSGDSDD